MNNILNKNLDIKGKKVLLRVDLNVPMKNGAITETSRIEKIIPTINLLIEKQAKIIIMSHIGRPKGKVVEGMSLKPISEKLSFLLKKKVLFNENIISENTLLEINKIPNGTYTNSMMIDGFEDPIKLNAKIVINKNNLIVDYSGTSFKSKFGINVPLSYTKAYTSFGLSCLISPEVPNNAGSLFPYSISSPEGTVLNAVYPASVCARHIIGQMLPDVVFGCLEKAIPNLTPAEGASCLWNLTFRGVQKDNKSIFAITAVTNGGTGARPSKDGLSATAYPSGVKGTPVEINEAVAPLLFLRKEFKPGSGGRGEYRGGDGQIIEIKSSLEKDLEILAAYDRIKFPPRGRKGGENGKAGSIKIKNGRNLKGKGTQLINAGEILVVETPGGGGYGPYKKRSKKLSILDKENELS